MKLGRVGPRTLQLLGLLWVVAIAVGMWRLAVYEWTPGRDAEPPVRWPAAAGPAPDRPTLLLFAHSRCPCTRASLDELAGIAAGAGDRLAIRVVLWDPIAPEVGAPGELVARAAAIPGAVQLVADDGSTGALFGVHTSGQALLYDVGGRLVYSGGITAGRGRVGPSPGRRALEEQLAGRVGPASAPVYGCALADCDARGTP